MKKLEFIADVMTFSVCSSIIFDFLSGMDLAGFFFFLFLLFFPPEYLLLGFVRRCGRFRGKEDFPTFASPEVLMNVRKFAIFCKLYVFSP